MKKWLEERVFPNGKGCLLHNFLHSNSCGSSVWKLGTEKGQTFTMKFLA
jgi:hypothetical protein